MLPTEKPQAEKTAFLYVRVSTEDQAREGVSLGDQLDRCRAHAVSLGAVVLREFREEGKSAYQGHRQAFTTAIELACIEQPTYLICWSSSRFARDRVVASVAKRQLQQAGVRLAYVSTSIDPWEQSGALIDGIFEVIDEAQSRQNSVDTKRSMASVARRGFWVNGRAPFGYALASEPGVKHKRLVVAENEATLVRRVFAMRLGGDGAQAIATTLNVEGWPFRGKRWTRDTVLHLLTNRIVTGVLVYGRKDRQTGRIRDESEWVIVKAYPVIIEPDDFEEVQTLLASAGAGCDSRESATSTHLLTGMIHCGECGSPMHIESAKGRHARYWYYACSAWLKRRECKPNRARADDLDSRMAAAICAEVFHADALAELLREVAVGAKEWATQRDQKKQACVQELTDLKRRQASLFDLLELHGRDAPNLGDLTVRLRELNAKIAALKVTMQQLEIERPPSLIASPESAGEVGQQFSAALQDPQNYKRTRVWVRSFVQRIDVGQETVTLTYDPARLVLSGAVHSYCKWLPGTDSNRRPGD